LHQQRDYVYYPAMTNENIDNFCRDLSHDLNNSLTGIMMTAELLMMSATSAREKERITDILDAAEEMSQLIEKHRQSFNDAKAEAGA